MNIIGALKKSNSPSTVYFCEYKEEDFKWDSVEELLKQCTLSEDDETQRLKKEDIYCIAIECEDRRTQSNPTIPDFANGTLVGVVFDSVDYYISFTSEKHADLNIYLNELTEDARKECESDDASTA